MDEFTKLLDENLDYVSHEIINGICYITVVSNRDSVNCPFCGKASKRVHSTYSRTFQDLPIQGNKVIIILRNRKIFCDNPECRHTTFAERFMFLPNKAKKSKRLEDEIVRLSLNCSSTAASELLRENVADVGKSDSENISPNFCDEWGYIPFEKEGSQLLFQVISECYERKSIIITANLEFSKWNGIFYDEKLTSAIIDRLVHHSHLPVHTGPNHRLTHSTMKSQ